MAAYVKKGLLDADQLFLSVSGAGKISPGTAKTAIESIGTGTQIRRAGSFKLQLLFTKKSISVMDL